MGNTIRRNVATSDSARARYAILQGRRESRANRREECDLDARAFNARIVRSVN